MVDEITEAEPSTVSEENEDVEAPIVRRRKRNGRDSS